MKIKNEIDRDAPLTNVEKASLGLFALWPLLAILAIGALFAGCAYKGGKVVDGTNLCIGMTIPGTEWTINALDYVGGIRVGGNDQTSITVSNEVVETNAYFGIVETRRHSRMTATIEPCVNEEEPKGDQTRFRRSGSKP